jgi:predicted DNA-binding transcriptional regulator YafY
MAKFKPQYRRLLFIDREIRRGRYPNCRSLAAEWEVSSKTIQRDIDYLRDELGAPLAYDPLRHGFLYTEPAYRLPSIDITERDLFAVCIAEQTLRAFRSTPLHDRLQGVFERIGAALPDRVSVRPSWLDERITVMPEPSTRIAPEVWDRLADALRGCRCLRLVYAGIGKAAAPRVVEPYHLVSYRGEWYLLAYCRRSRGARTFALSRIRAAELLEETASPPETFDGREIIEEQFGIIRGGRPRRVRIRFSPRAAAYIREREWHAGQVLRDTPEGGVELAYTTRHLYEVKDWVLSWGQDARALAPPALVRELAREIAAMAAHYA